jgi:histone arginine demethylase JMJD6
MSDLEFYGKTGLCNQPFVLEGFMTQWPAFTKWTPDFFCKNHGNLLVEVRSVIDDSAKKLTLNEYFDYFNNPERDKNYYYLKDWVFQDDIPELLKDYTIPSFFKSWAELLPVKHRPKLRWFYIGPKGSGSALHIDVMKTSAWNGVVSGKKHWHFYSPDQYDLLYNLKVDTFNPDLKKFPLLANVQPITCIQNPGDVVFTPGGWPHQVLNAESGISITENFVNESNFNEVMEFLEMHNMQEHAGGLRLVKKILNK